MASLHNRQAPYRITNLLPGNQFVAEFALQDTRLTDPERLNHLFLAIAVAMLWIYDIGEEVLNTDERQEIDPAYKRQLSVFQIGWRKLQRWLSCQSSTLPFLTLRLSPFRLAPSWQKC